MPFGSGAVNEEGIAHYNDVINTCLEYNLIPMATLYHWDTPFGVARHLRRMVVRGYRR